MSRLTRKTNIKNNLKNCYYYENINNSTTVDVYNKLGKLEDIEDELGCPLEVVFEALDKGVHIKIYYLGTFITDDILKPRLYYSDDFHCYCFELLFGECVVKISDYKKTWWLPRDEE